MEVVFAKHLDSDKEFLFSCEGQPLTQGDCLIVDTMYGKRLAIATSYREQCSPSIVHRFGAYLPLRKVLLVVTEEYADLVISAVKKGLILDNGLPF